MGLIKKTFSKLNPKNWFSSRSRAVAQRTRRAKKSFSLQQKAISHFSQHLQTTTFTGSGFQGAYRKGYLKNALPFSAIDYYKRAIGQATMVVKDEDGEIVEGHWFNELTSNPNSHMDERNLLDVIIGHYWLAGNVYIGSVWDKAGTRPMELWPLMPHKMQLKLDPEEVVKGYVYTVDGEDQNMGKDQVAHIRYQDMTDLALGRAPIQSAMRRIAIDNEMTRHIKSLLENSAIPGIIMKFADRNLIENEDKRERYEERYKKKFGGEDRGSPGFLGKDDEVKTVGMDMEQLAMPEVSKDDEARILSVMGVSPILLNVRVGLDRAMRKNYKQARKAFWQDAAFDLQDRIAKSLTEQILKPAEGEDTDLRVGWDNSEVSAVQDIKRMEKVDARKEWSEGLITRNEYREKFDEESLDEEEGDVFKNEIQGQSLGSGLEEPEDRTDDEDQLEDEEDMLSERTSENGNGSPKGLRRR